MLSISQGTLDYRVHFSYGGAPISPWHDIPLAATPAGLDGPLHFCCEIPKWTRRKFEARESATAIAPCARAA